MGEKHKYKNDYEVKSVERKGFFGLKRKKELVYTGTFYVFENKESKVKQMSWLSFALVCFIAALFIGVGFLNNEGTRKIYVTFPYIFMFLPIFYGFLGTMKSIQSKTRMSRIEYERSVERVKKSSFSLVVLSIATVIGQGLFIIRNQVSGVHRFDYIFLSGILLIGGIAFLLFQVQKKYVVREENK